MNALDTIAKYLFFVLILDFTLEALDQIHRIYEAEESFEIISLLVSGKLYITLFIMQVLLGTFVRWLPSGFCSFTNPRKRSENTYTWSLVF